MDVPFLAKCEILFLKFGKSTVIDASLMKQEVILYARMITLCKQGSYLHTVVLQK
jgi:hypothetical protein